MRTSYTFQGGSSGAWGGGLGAFKPGGAFGGGGSSAAAPAGVDGDILKKREQNLEAREQELSMKEKELKDLEAKLKSSGQLVAPKNWPPCCPILRHDIAADIPGPLQNSVKMVYVSYVGETFCFAWQCLAVTAALFGASQDAHDDHKILQAWLLSIIYMVTGVPGGFLLWYMRLYTAAQKDRALTYFMFFIFYSAHIIWCIWSFMAPPIGVQVSRTFLLCPRKKKMEGRVLGDEESPLAAKRVCVFLCLSWATGLTTLSSFSFFAQWSYTGLMSMAEAFNENSVLGIFYLIGVILWALEGLLSLYCMKVAYASFRGRADPNEAKSQFAQAVISRV